MTLLENLQNIKEVAKLSQDLAAEAVSVATRTINLVNEAESLIGTTPLGTKVADALWKPVERRT